MRRKPLLTARELEVLRLICQGDTSAVVAEELSISKRTVDFHLANVYRKLKVVNRIGAANRAMQLGLINAPVGRAA
jgi:DNA-binding CsgD family transcriptional regulator